MIAFVVPTSRGDRPRSDIVGVVVFSVLFVCTGNICRSPMAERLFRVRVDPALPTAATSAGTAGLPDRPMDAPSACALRELGGDPDGHAGRRLTEAMVADADLILTAELAHRAVIVQADPLAFRRTFTLREFGRLGAALGPLSSPVGVQELRERVRAVAAERGNVGPAGPRGDDIDDPYGAAIDVARLRAGEVAAAVDDVIGALGLKSGAK
jgi:protein-tyrosine phosphatase